MAIFAASYILLPLSYVYGVVTDTTKEPKQGDTNNKPYFLFQNPLQSTFTSLTISKRSIGADGPTISRRSIKTYLKRKAYFLRFIKAKRIICDTNYEIFIGY